MPKQFLPLVGERSTYQQALLRVADGDLFAPPIVVTSAEFRFFVRRQAEDVGIAAKPCWSRSNASRPAIAVLRRHEHLDAAWRAGLPANEASALEGQDPLPTQERKVDPSPNVLQQPAR